ncbi:hypothetical protein TanjilG_01520 [Lupinus angustifolius]|uniref:uncharacterized protein LOC109335016 n=1 Tax=Lupinus angustifolius TaxID=3871 RepID=UPI00090CF62E|nr:PREDICTED: uncharacterized protein LOC109335016 [Lupinus angustifolius]OIV90066.1 hypothetical protein TanjilG_01520 [Lupinus angustifolius]
MNIDEWEFLSDDAFLDFNEDGDKNYFSSSPSSRKIIEQQKNPRVVHNNLIPLPILLEPKIPMEVTIVSPSPKTEKTKPFETVSVESDQETVSQVFFKLKENEFVDMKMDSPKSSSRVLFSQMDKGEGIENNITSPRMKIGKEIISMECDKEEDSSSWEEENTSGFNMLKWSLTGVGAICSFGVAVAAVCVMFFGTRQRNKLQQDHKIRFQIYADDKRIKQVLQHATKLNDAISAVRGVPMSTAHITIGGYYDGL